jgi:hypothetical protein
MAPPRIWPRTKEERADRARVVQLVYAVGKQQVRWTVYDLHRAMKADARYQLHCQRQLSRHLRDLEPETVVSAGRRGTVQTSAQGRVKKVYCLTCRQGELHHGAPNLDDVERAIFAVAAACAALGVEEVPTVAVTAVMRRIEALAPESRRQTLALLKSAGPTVERSPREDHVAWWKLGNPVVHPELDAWVEKLQAEGFAADTPAATGRATVNAAVAELVRIAVEQSRDSVWPAGRPVDTSDLAALAGRDPRATELAQWVERRNATASAVLGDLTKPRPGRIRSRVTTPVVRIQTPPGMRSFYDTPTVEGLERRALYVDYRVLQEYAAPAMLEAIDREYRGALTLVQHSNPDVRRCGLIRCLNAVRDAEDLAERARRLMSHEDLLSLHVRKSVARRLEAVRAVLESKTSRNELEERVRDAVADLPWAARAAGPVARPLIVAEEYASWFPEGAAPSAAAFLAGAVPLKRYPNPNHTNRSDPDPGRASITAVDRVDAILYVVSRHESAILHFLEGGAAILGSGLRLEEPVAMLLASGDPVLRRRALAALALLGSPLAVEQAGTWLLNSGGEGSDILAALYALCCMKAVDLSAIPAGLLQDGRLRTPVLAIATAVRQRRWLLQQR